VTAVGGFLAIWSDIDPADETEYLHWLTREHAAERVGLPGFLGVRVFRARLPERRRYFILYRLEDPGGIVAVAGRGEGSVVLPIFCELEELEALRTAVEGLAAVDRMVAARLFRVRREGMDIRTVEKSMREQDESFPALLLLEALGDDAIPAALTELRTLLPKQEPLTPYDQVFALTLREVAGT
jgi:hypothetical protein